MSKKRTASKSSPKPRPQQKAAASPGDNKTMWVVAAIIVALFAFSAWAASNSKKADVAGTAGTQGTTAPGTTAPTASPEEQKYIGRLLPEGYAAPTVEPVSYTSVTKMTDVTATAKGKKVTLPIAEIIAAKMAFFEYTRPDGQAIPMVAYVRPSGKLFVGVSYCIPCKGTKQYVDADGTLTCDSCGTKRDLETGVGISGACRLYPLDEVVSEVAGDKLVIQKSDLDSWTPQPMDRKVG